MDKHLDEEAISAEIMSYVKTEYITMRYSSTVIGELAKHTSSRKVLFQTSRNLGICQYTFPYMALTLRTLFLKRLRFPF